MQTPTPFEPIFAGLSVHELHAVSFALSGKHIARSESKASATARVCKQLAAESEVAQVLDNLPSLVAAKGFAQAGAIIEKRIAALSIEEPAVEQLDEPCEYGEYDESESQEPAEQLDENFDLGVPNSMLSDDPARYEDEADDWDETSPCGNLLPSVAEELAAKHNVPVEHVEEPCDPHHEDPAYWEHQEATYRDELADVCPGEAVTVQVVENEYQGPPRRLSAEETAQARHEIEQAEGDIEEFERAAEQAPLPEPTGKAKRLAKRAATRTVAPAKVTSTAGTPKPGSKLRVVYDLIERAEGVTGGEIKVATGLTCVTQLAASAAKAHMAEMVIAREGRGVRYSLKV
jgi:hypothetical protein